MARITKEQLASLTKEEKLALLDVVEEKKRRVREQRRAFTPHAGQRAIIDSNQKIKIVTAANGSGKTAVAVNMMLWYAHGYNPVSKATTRVPARIYVVLDSPAKIADVWIPEIKKWYNLKEEQLAKLGKPFISQINFDNGSTLRFLFHEQNELAFESIEGDYFIFDEPCDKRLWTALLRAGRTKNSDPKYIMIGTPLSQAWLREYFVEWEKGNFPDTQFFKMSTEANRVNLAEGYIEDYSRHLTEAEKRTRLHGEFFNTDGMALAGLFKRDRHILPASQLASGWQSWPIVLAADPHPNKPTHLCLLAAGPENQLYYVAESAQKLTPRDFAKWVKTNWLPVYNIVDLVVDNFGSGDFTGGDGFKSFVEIWREEGLMIRPTSYDEKSDTDFLERLQDALYIPEGGQPRLRLLATCLGIIRDIENVQWKKKKGTDEFEPKLEIGNRDYLATLKYALAVNLTWQTARRKVIRTSETVKHAANTVHNVRKSMSGGYLVSKTTRKKPTGRDF